MATRPTITESQGKVFEPRTIAFPAVVQDQIREWLHKQIEELTKRNQNLHEKKIPEWRRIIEGEPREETKSWPFPNCSNLVHPLVGEAVDDLAARVLMLVWGTAPTASFKYFTETNSQEEATRNKKKSTTLEQFIDYVASQPDELNLYTVENEWYTDAAGLGRGYVCVVPEQRMEAVYAGYYKAGVTLPDGSRHGSPVVEFDGDNGETELYCGPKVQNVDYEDILVHDHKGPFEDNDPIIRRCKPLTQRKLKERGFQGHFDPEMVKKVIGSPDRYGDSPQKIREMQKKGITPDITTAEWDVYECYFSWWHNKKKYRLIAWHHQKTNTNLNCVYNFIPRNQVPIIETRLSVKGKGFAQMLKFFQEEISTAKNQRNDAITYGTLGVNTIDLQQSKTIDRNFTVNPGMFIPAKKDAFQHFEMANAAIASLSLQNEEAMIMQAKMRAGVDPSIRAAGAGTTNKKGQYSAMGTLSTMQDGNSRNDHRTSDFRHSRIKLIGLCVDFYGFLGLGRKARLAGLSNELLAEALKDYGDRNLKMSMRAATASMNREITKQNLIILNQNVSMYIKETSSQIQAIMNDTIPPQYKKWLFSVITSKTLMMQEIVRTFQISEQPTEFVPDVSALQEFVNEKKQQQSGQQQPAPGGPVPISQLAQILRGRGQG